MMAGATGGSRVGDCVPKATPQRGPWEALPPRPTSRRPKYTEGTGPHGPVPSVLLLASDYGPKVISRLSVTTLAFLPFVPTTIHS